MKKLLTTIFLLTLTLFASTGVLAEGNAIPTMDNITFEISGSQSGAPGERIPITVTMNNIDTGFVCEGGWLINETPIQGFYSQNYTATNGKSSTLNYTIPKDAVVGQPINLTFRLYGQYGIAEKVVSIDVKKPNLTPIVSINKANITAYKGRVVPITVTVKDPNNSNITIPIIWKKDGVPIKGFSNDSWQVNKSRTSTYNFLANEKVGSKVKISFTINPNNLPGITKQTVSTTVTIKQETNYYLANKDRVLKMVKEVNVEARVLGTAPVYSSKSMSKKIGSVNKGDRVTFEDNKGNAAKVKLSNGKWVWMPFNKLTISNKNYTNYTDFSKAEKEVFVKAKGYKSDTNLLVWLNLEHQKINIFKNVNGEWQLIKVCPCTSGKNATPTERGVFKYYKKANKWDFNQYYVKRPMSFNGGHAFHTRTYTPSGGLLDATMGTPKSQGCVRMLDADVNWLWTNMKIGTTVVVF